MVMGTSLSKMNAICPKCKETVGLRPGKRLLKHGHSDDPYHSRPPCSFTGQKVTDADIVAWARREVRWRQQEMDRATGDRVAYEGHLARMIEQEKVAADVLAAAKKALADLEAQAPQ